MRLRYIYWQELKSYKLDREKHKKVNGETLADFLHFTGNKSGNKRQKTRRERIMRPYRDLFENAH